MMDDLLRNMDQNQRFAKAQVNNDDVDPHEAAQYVEQYMRSAPPEMQQQALQQYMQQLDPQQREALAQAMIQHQGTPVQNVRADDPHDLTNAFMQSGQALSQQGRGGGIGDLFGMMGGMLGGMGQGMGGQQQGGGLGGLLGGLLGGGQQQQQGYGQQGQGYQQGYGQQGQGYQQGYGQPAQQQQGGGLGQLLQNPMAKAGLVSLAAIIGSQLMGANRR
ncbi:hypothetical protein [Deinococcus yavapaiensis]|uniref:Uncharacterized protein n=1 Tax=Deinococcus yavapaiensis KR-236 TaxID=694435 RepID=A0A318SBI3_9DEIO|nr:hypothetical protein [Deinococcus yavapaiensis]PYE54561.1 hypothetical protein DES52_105199 [Deinococcus yavapaiensis KR-236]